MQDTPMIPTEPAALTAVEPAAPPPELAATPQTPLGASLATPPQRRIPHFGHLALLSFLLLGGLICSVVLILVALHFRLFGVARLEDAMHSMAYAIGTMIVWYAVAFAPAAAVFPSLWGKKLLAGIQWNAAAPRRLWPRLVAIGAACFLLALSAKSILHFPDKSPIAGLMSTPAAVWIMFAFAVTLAPLCEEILFRGFLLPALSTAFDWTGEKLTGRPARPLLAGDHPQWSLPAMILASVLTSAVFAAFHMGQNGSALGPLALIFTVSLVLCAVRLATRSLAASTLTHASYNFTLFLAMAVTTHGFQHLHP